jgi:hypothetical protein
MDTEEAERYLMGRSPEEEVADFEEHLLVCARCRQHLSSVDLYISSMSEAAAEVSASKEFTAYGNWQLLKLLAAIGTVAGLALLGVLAAWYD